MQWAERVKKAQRAGTKLRAAVQRGDVKRKHYCELCNFHSYKLEGAHLDYRRPLVVHWLCRQCHVRWDKKNPKTNCTGKLPLSAMSPKRDRTGETDGTTSESKIHSIHIPDRLWAQFRELGKAEDRPITYMVRKAIEAYLERKGTKKS